MNIDLTLSSRQKKCSRAFTAEGGLQAINVDVTFDIVTAAEGSAAYASDMEVAVTQLSARDARVAVGYDDKDNEFSGENDKKDTDGG